MSGYFEDILESYRPAEPITGTDAPWTDPITEAATPDLPFSDVGAATGPDDVNVPLAHPELPEPDDFRETVHRSPPEREPPAQPTQAQPLEPNEQIVAHETRVIERPADIPPAPDSGIEEPIQATDPDIYVREHVDHSTTHIHEHFENVDNNMVFEPEPEETESRAPAEGHPAPEPTEPVEQDPGPALAAIETELARALARLHGEFEPQQPLVSPSDFEPEVRDNPIPTDIEPVREVTREVVTEIHHHHTNESRAEQPARPAPRTAAEASRIGPIRFAAAWKKEER